jgi:hypothetical protein
MKKIILTIIGIALIGATYSIVNKMIMEKRIDSIVDSYNQEQAQKEEGLVLEQDEKNKEQITEQFIVSSFLPTNATDIDLKYGDFNGDGHNDAVVFYTLENVVINSSGGQGTKQYLETYLWNVKNEEYEMVRKDEGLLGWLTIEDFQIVDFNQDGNDEVYVLKLHDGSGMYNSFYVMGYKNNTMIDFYIEKEVQDQNYKNSRAHDYVFVKDNILKRKLSILNEDDPNCCPTGPTIYTEWKLENKSFKIEKEEIIFENE